MPGGQGFFTYLQKKTTKRVQTNKEDQRTHSTTYYIHRFPLHFMFFINLVHSKTFPAGT